MTLPMTLSPSAHVDTFCRDNLPASETWPELLFELPELHYPQRLNCGVELLDRVAERLGPDRPCLLAPDGEPWSYGQLQRLSDQLAHVLVEDHGIVPGNRVLLRGPNNQWLVACWFAVMKVGAVAVTTMPMLRAGELTTICEIASVDLCLCDAGCSTTSSPPACPATASLPTAPRPPSPPPRRRSRPSSLRWTPPRTTSPCSPSRPGRPAGPRRPCTSTATCWRSPTPSRPTC